MRPDVEELSQWYASAAGQRAATALALALAPLIRRGATSRLLALGYCAQILEGFDPASVERLILACPSGQGGCTWPGDTANLSAEVDELALPFVDALFDQILIVHALEYSAPPGRLLRELWRVLAPGGNIVLVVPNRMGLWVHFEATPFGQGTPFGQNQIRKLLGDSLFEIDHRQTLLAMPPIRALKWLDRPMMKLAPKLGGLHIIRAVKTDGAMPIPVGRVKGVRRVLASRGMQPSCR